MTAHKHLKQLVRARMQKTGESYAAARRNVIAQEPSEQRDPATSSHYPGNVPGATALRVLLTHAGIRDPRTGAPFSEAMLYGIAGGVSIGVFAFHYAKENFSSFYIAGRHKWWDDLDYLRTAIQLFGIEPVVRESSGSGKAFVQLGEALEQQGPCAVWVEGYRVITAYKILPDEDVALIGDLADEPIRVPLPELAATRARVVKQKNRLLSVPKATVTPDLGALVRKGLENCYRELEQPSMKFAPGNFQLEVIRTLAQRMHGSREKESWDRIFPRGGPLWTGLTSLYEYTEHWGTGGGLGRPLYADFLRESADIDPRLAALADRYSELGRAWTSLADAALPDDVPLLRESRDLIASRSELKLSGGAAEETSAIRDRLEELRRAACAEFPLSEADCDLLRASLSKRLFELYDAEKRAHAALGVLLAT